MGPAFVTGLPRSRTYWFAEYFQSCGVTAYHELLNGIESRDKFYQVMEDGAIDSDCGLILTDFQMVFPKAPCVIIHRDPAAVHKSLGPIMDALGYDTPTVDQLWEMDEELHRLNGMHILFDEIDYSLRDIHEYLAPGVPYDYGHARDMIAKNLQVDPASYTIDAESAQLWRREK